jgi:hypothetical protein
MASKKGASSAITAARAAKVQAVKAAKHPTALDRRDHGGGPVSLTKAQELLLMEAVRRGESAQRVNQDTMLEFGQWLLDSVFGGDTSAALDPKSQNPIWMELVRRAGGPTLHVSTRFLYVALRISAYDKRITDESWRLLDVGRKELLLPLVDVTALREAARHVIKFDLTHKMVQAYVNGQLAEQGDTRAVRWTAPQMQKQLEKLHTMLAERAPVRRLRELRSSLSDEQRDGLLTRAKELQKALAVVTRELRK